MVNIAIHTCQILYCQCSYTKTKGIGIFVGATKILVMHVSGLVLQRQKLLSFFFYAFRFTTIVVATKGLE